MVSLKGSRIAVFVALLIAALTLSVLSLGAQARPDTAAVAVDVTPAVKAALSATPATVADLAAATKLPEAQVRAALSRLVYRREIRYRLIPLANGDTTATGRPRRERAYYLDSPTPPPASGRPSPRRR